MSAGPAVATVVSKGAQLIAHARSVEFSGKASGVNGAIYDNATGASVSISAEDGVSLSNKAEISVRSLGQGDAGEVVIRAGITFSMTGGSSLLGDASESNGGNIKIYARDLVSIQDSTINAKAAKQGGSIFIDPHFVVVNNALISAQGQAGGLDGSLTIQSDYFLERQSQIFSTGPLTIASVKIDLSNSLGGLNVQFTPVSTRLQERCAMRLGGEVSSFLVVGRGGIASDPEGLFEEPALWERRGRRE